MFGGSERVKESTRYIESIYGEDPRCLEKVKETIIENEMPSISVSPGLGRFLTSSSAYPEPNEFWKWCTGWLQRNLPGSGIG